MSIVNKDFHYTLSLIPKTNGDRIRQMSNEELAEFLHKEICPPPLKLQLCDAFGCKDCWLNWLHSEYKENEK